MLEFLYKALSSPHGIVLKVSDVERARQRLYAERRDAKDPALDALALVPSPSAPTEELWIVKKGDKSAPSEGN